MNRRLLAAVIALVSGTFAARAADMPSAVSNPSAPVAATTPWNISVSLGAGAAPDYEGSNDYVIVPAIAATIGYDNRYISLEGFDLKANLIDSKTINAGPLVSFQLGRKDIEDQAVKSFAEIDDSVAVGAFASYTLSGVVSPFDSVTFGLQGTGDVSGVSDGFLGAASIGYATAVSESLFFTVTATTSFASKDYARTYFGVSPSDAAASGLPAYTLDGGFKDVGLGTTLTYAFTDSWSFTIVGSVKQLLGDFAKSPIVDDRGSATQFAGFGTINRTF